MYPKNLCHNLLHVIVQLAYRAVTYIAEKYTVACEQTIAHQRRTKGCKLKKAFLTFFGVRLSVNMQECVLQMSQC